MSVSEWDNEYARLARAASQLRTSGLSTAGGDWNSLRQGLTRLDASLNTLPLQSGEVQRRRRLIQNLQSTTSTTSAAGARGLDAGGVAAASSAVGPQSQMAMAMSRQDELIDDLAAGVGRLKNQTINIGDEARMHVNLLNDMDDNLDAAQASLDAETRRAARIKEDQSLWRLQLIVAGLFILLILLLLLGLSP